MSRGQGPQALALPVALLTLLWPHPLASDYRSQWPSFTDMEYDAQHARAIDMSTCLVREVA